MAGRRTALLAGLFLALLVRSCGAEGYNPFAHLWYGTRDIPDAQNAVVLGAGTAAALASLALDRSVHDYFAGKDRLNGLDGLGNNVLGTGVPGALIGLGTLGAGLLWGRPHEVNAGEAHLEALAATAGYTALLKDTVHRRRPASRSPDAFPSGHTSTVFASAASLMDFYGPKAGLPALALAAYTGVCRLSADAHRLSDVVAGAALGYALGHAYARHHLAPQDGRSTEVLPYFQDGRGFGLQASLRF